MPGPSSDSETTQTRGAATPQETAFSSTALAQADQALNAMRTAGQDPRLMAATIDGRIAEQQTRMAAAQARLKYLDEHFARYGTGPQFTNNEEHVAVANQQLANAKSSLMDLQAQKTLIPEMMKGYESTQRLTNLASSRLEDFLSGRDIGVSPQERELITQGISGISQDVATTRGLNRSDVPVMQAVAPAVSAALLQQANANRSLFTGINQFQQGMDLSGRQLQAGLAGQNPAANLTGVYSGLRSSDFSTSSKQGYGTLDYVNAGANLASGIGSAAYGFNAGGGGGGTGGVDMSKAFARQGIK